MGIAGVMALTFMSGCSQAQPSGTGAPVDSGPVTPKVSRFVFAVSAPPLESNRPAVAASTSFWVLMPMYENLIGASETGQEMVPMLAERWAIEPDGKSYRFNLRRGVKFHDDKGEFTAKDVHYSWQANKNETDPLRPTQPLTVMNQIKEVEIPNDYELVMRLDRPDSGFLLAISLAENTFPIMSKADGETRPPPTMLDKPLAGTGPYRYVGRAQGEWVRYQRGPDKHWRQTPEFPEFEWRYIKEDSTRQAALMSREVQAAALPPDLTRQAEQAGLKIIAGKAPGLHVFMTFLGVWINQRLTQQEVLNSDPNAAWIFPNTPLFDVRVRRALNKAVDRDAMNKAFLKGKGDPIYLEYFHPTRPGWNPEWEKRFKDSYGYDPEAAKKLLAEAGYGPGRPLSTTIQLRPYGYFPAAMEMDEAVQNYWRAIGVDVKLEQKDSVEFTAKSRRAEYDNHSYVVVTSARAMTGIGAYNGMHLLNRGGVQLPELAELFKEIQIAVDPKKNNELWRKWGDIAYEQYINLPLFWVPSEATVDPNVVADYVFPGSISGTYTHVEYLKAQR